MRGGLARAVVAEEGDHLAGRDMEVEVVHHLLAAVAGVQVLQAQERCPGRGGPRQALMRSQSTPRPAVGSR